MEFQTVKNIARFKDILLVLVKYGFEDIVEKIKYPGFALFRHKTAPVKATNQYERIRLGLEELGPTYIKIGQVLSMRPDLVPPPFIEELQKLQDSVAPEDFGTMREQIINGLGRPIEEVFEFFDEKPLSAASMAQVYYARLRETGEEVAVKVRRPGIKGVVREDVEILRFVANQVHKHLETYRDYDLPAMVEEIWSAMQYELDFTVEARNLEIFGLNFAGNDAIMIPRVHRQWSSDSILTMEYIDGIKIRSIPPDFEHRERIAVQGVQAIIQQILKDGLFHADPHGGNILVTKEGRLCFIDFGQVGVLTLDMRQSLVELVEAVMERDSKEVVRIGVRISRFQSGLDKTALERDVMRHLLQLDPNAERGKIGRFLLELAQIFKRHRVNLHQVYFIIFKAILTAENLAYMLCPRCRIWEEIMPYVEKISSKRFAPARLIKDTTRELISAARSLKEFPDRLDNLMRRIEEQKIAFTFRHEGLDNFTQSVENVSNRISFGIIIGSLIIGSSLIVTTGVGPLMFGFPLFGIAGYVISGVMGIWLAISMIRKKKL